MERFVDSAQQEIKGVPRFQGRFKVLESHNGVEKGKSIEIN